MPEICEKCGIDADELVQSKDSPNIIICKDCSIREDLARHGLNLEQQEIYLATIHAIKASIKKLQG